MDELGAKLHPTSQGWRACHARACSGVHCDRPVFGVCCEVEHPVSASKARARPIVERWSAFIFVTMTLGFEIRAALRTLGCRATGTKSEAVYPEYFYESSQKRC